jgi:uncharacterized membrane protein
MIIKVLSFLSNTCLRKLAQYKGFSVILAVLWVSSFGFARPAEASLNLCNDTSYVLKAAVAYSKGKKWQVEGWWSIQPGTCSIAIKEPLKSQDYYTFAQSIPGHEGGVKAWGGRYTFCTGVGTFSLANRPNCEQDGLTLLGFSKIDTGGEKSWTSNFSEAADFDRKKARIAGIQRLLNDIGYDRVNIDGYVGRRTRLAITKFKSDNKLPPGEELTNELFDAMARAANDRVQKAGLELCNSTEFDLFAAVADSATSGIPTSRGWYHLGKGQCARVIKDPLKDASYYAYAEAELPTGDFYVWGGEKTFCTNDIRFSIESKETCTTLGYAERGFAEVKLTGEPHSRHNFTMSNYTEPAIAAPAENSPEVNSSTEAETTDGQPLPQ